MQSYGIMCKANYFTGICIIVAIRNKRITKGVSFMFEKDLNIGLLLDFYGDILTERKKDALDLYYNNDMSLSEIADEMHISRQGVRDIIKKAEEELFFYEEKLGLAKKFESAQIHAKRAIDLCDTLSIPEEIKNEIKLILDNIG